MQRYTYCTASDVDSLLSTYRIREIYSTYVHTHMHARVGTWTYGTVLYVPDRQGCDTKFFAGEKKLLPQKNTSCICASKGKKKASFHNHLFGFYKCCLLTCFRDFFCNGSHWRGRMMWQFISSFFSSRIKKYKWKRRKPLQHKTLKRLRISLLNYRPVHLKLTQELSPDFINCTARSDCWKGIWCGKPTRLYNCQTMSWATVNTFFLSTIHFGNIFSFKIQHTTKHVFLKREYFRTV